MTSFVLVIALMAWMLVYWTPSNQLDPPSDEATTDLPQPSVTVPTHISEERSSALRNILFPRRDKHEDLHHDFLFVEVNHVTLSSLMLCLELSNCKPNQDKGEVAPIMRPRFVSVADGICSVVLLQWFHFRGALTGWVMGEDIWFVLDR